MPGDGAIGTRLGRDGTLVLKRRLGQGLSSDVWLAEDEKRGLPVAVKLLLPGAAADGDLRQRFVREGKRFAALRHPNLVKVMAMGQHAARLYLVLEYVPGPNLHELLKKEGALAPELALSIIGSAARGLAVAHAADVIHRDLKPANVMLRKPDGRVKVLDFGIAKDLTSQTGLTQIGTFVGTPAYSAPEQISGAKIGPGTDIYALGIMLYELVTGHVDPKGRHGTKVMRATLREDRIPLGNLYQEVVRPVARLIHRMTRRDPERRPATMDEVATGCAGIIASRAGEPPASPADSGEISGVFRRAFEAEG